MQIKPHLQATPVIAITRTEKMSAKKETVRHKKKKEKADGQGRKKKKASFGYKSPGAFCRLKSLGNRKASTNTQSSLT